MVKEMKQKLCIAAFESEESAINFCWAQLALNHTNII